MGYHAEPHPDTLLGFAFSGSHFSFGSGTSPWLGKLLLGLPRQNPGIYIAGSKLEDGFESVLSLLVTTGFEVSLALLEMGPDVSRSYGYNLFLLWFGDNCFSNFLLCHLLTSFNINLAYFLFSL